MTSFYRPCTHFSRRHRRLCSCIDFKDRSDKDTCRFCGHGGEDHPIVKLRDDEPNTQLNTPTPSPSPPPMPIASSSRTHVISTPTTKHKGSTKTVQSIVAKNISESSKVLLTNLGKELKHGMKIPLKSNPHAVSNGGSSTRRTIKAAEKPTPTPRVLAVVLNPHGLVSMNGADVLKVNSVVNRAKLEHYVALGLAIHDKQNGLSIDTNLDHPETVRWLQEVFPALNHLYVDSEEKEKRSPWVLCSKLQKRIIIVPTKWPTTFDLYDKRTLDSKSWAEQYIYIAFLASRDPIPQAVLRKHAPEADPVQFNNVWASLAELEHWPDNEDSDVMEVEVQRTQKRKRPLDDEGSEAEDRRVHKTPRRSGRLQSRAVSKNSKGKGKERAAIRHDDEDSLSLSDDSSVNLKEESAIVSDLILSSPVKVIKMEESEPNLTFVPFSAPTKINDPWNPDRQFRLP
ncbi:hypothetical protein K435DRAFT_811468 [Dendrothele bispora CBS 962.96]|uniref:Uncharacterized protein n=1 Tax=Dendrothele bispora (strain CBS 962.96) TaxID=1314807 RepID=A0A4V4HB95_DENBC|nr:hypothetical protein K435DRAFT_811468 [Dendrothele bispora CBS 962.96]